MKMAPFSAGLEPDAAGRSDLPLPDRHAGLYRLDSSPAGRKSLGPMGSRSRHDDGDITHLERANSMAEKYLRVWMAAGEVFGDAGHLPFGHGPVGLVFQPIHRMAFVLVAHDTHEKGKSAVFSSPNDGQERTGVERVRRKEGHGNMIRPEAGIER